MDYSRESTQNTSSRKRKCHQEDACIYVRLTVWSAVPLMRTEKLLHPDHGHRLLLDVVEWVGLELDSLEVDVHEIDAADVAVPGCPVV